MPTLDTVGNLVQVNELYKQKDLDNLVPYEFILNRMTIMLSKKNDITFKDRVLIIKAETGSGKSTLLPARIYEKFLLGNRQSKNIICTQPRVANASDIPKSMTDNNYYPFLKMGINIGYQTGSLKYKIKEEGILYCTAGTFAGKLKGQDAISFINKYSVIILDEVHVLSSELESILSNIIEKMTYIFNETSQDCPFIICMSATFDENKFLKFFELTKDNYIKVTGFSFPIEKRFKENDNPENLIQYVKKLVYKIHTEPEDLDDFTNILIFMPGGTECKEMIRVLDDLNSEFIKNPDKYGILYTLQLDRNAVNNISIGFKNMSLPINALIGLTSELKNLQSKIKRKVIVATNVAETGLTIENLRYVIDSGYTKDPYFIHKWGVEILFQEPITKNMSIQRAGRSGRKNKGIYYACFTEKNYISFRDYDFPDVIKSQSDDLFKQLIKNVNNTSIPKTLTKISNDSMNYFAYKLNNLIVTDDMFAILKKINLPIEISVFILSSLIYEVNTLDLITISAFIMLKEEDRVIDKNSKDSFTNRVYFYYIKELLKDTKIDKSNTLHTAMRYFINDDFIDYLFLYDYLIQNNVITNYNLFSENKDLSLVNLIKMLELRDEIILAFCNAGVGICKKNSFREMIYKKDSLNEISYSSFGDKLVNMSNSEDGFINYIYKLKQCINFGFKLNTAINIDGNKYINNLGFVFDIYFKNDMNFKPKKILYSSILTKYSRKNKTYSAYCKDISVCDGWI